MYLNFVRPGIFIMYIVILIIPNKFVLSIVLCSSLELIKQIHTDSLPIKLVGKCSLTYTLI